MQPLLRKEYLVNRQTVLITILVMVIGGFITTNSTQISLTLAVVFSILQPFSSDKSEDLSRSEVLINSLPVTRKKIIISKYLYSVIITLTYFAITYGMNILIPTFTANSLSEIYIGWIVAALFLTVYYPLFYLLGPRFLTLGMFAIIFLILAVGFPIMNIGAKNGYWGIQTYLVQFSIIQLGIATLIISTILLISSYSLSNKIYQKKNF